MGLGFLLAMTEPSQVASFAPLAGPIQSAHRMTSPFVVVSGLHRPQLGERKARNLRTGVLNVVVKLGEKKFHAHPRTAPRLISVLLANILALVHALVVKIAFLLSFFMLSPAMALASNGMFDTPSMVNLVTKLKPREPPAPDLAKKGLNSLLQEAEKLVQGVDEQKSNVSPADPSPASLPSAMHNDELATKQDLTARLNQAENLSEQRKNWFYSPEARKVGLLLVSTLSLYSSYGGEGVQLVAQAPAQPQAQPQANPASEALKYTTSAVRDVADKALPAAQNAVKEVQLLPSKISAVRDSAVKGVEQCTHQATQQVTYYATDVTKKATQHITYYAKDVTQKVSDAIPADVKRAYADATALAKPVVEPVMASTSNILTNFLVNGKRVSALLFEKTQATVATVATVKTEEHLKESLHAANAPMLDAAHAPAAMSTSAIEQTLETDAAAAKARARRQWAAVGPTATQQMVDAAGAFEELGGSYEDKNPEWKRITRKELLSMDFHHHDHDDAHDEYEVDDEKSIVKGKAMDLLELALKPLNGIFGFITVMWPITMATFPVIWVFPWDLVTGGFKSRKIFNDMPGSEQEKQTANRFREKVLWFTTIVNFIVSVILGGGGGGGGGHH